MLRWSPDTCKCVLEYDGQSNGVPASRIVKSCKEHETLVTPEDLHDAVLSENVLKNITGSKLKDVPEMVGTVVDNDGAYLDPSKWEFDKDRNLVINCPVLSSSAKIDAISKIDASIILVEK